MGYECPPTSGTISPSPLQFCHIYSFIRFINLFISLCSTPPQCLGQDPGHTAGNLRFGPSSHTNELENRSAA